MKKWNRPALILLLTGIFSLPICAWCAGSHLASETSASEKIKEAPEWVEALKNQHHLSEEHIAFMQSHGLSFPEMSLVSTLSEKSGKTVDDILDMKAKDKKGWDQIAQELEVSQEEVGRSIASTRQEVESEKKLHDTRRSEIQSKQCATETLISCNFTVTPSEVRSSSQR